MDNQICTNSKYRKISRLKLKKKDDIKLPRNNLQSQRCLSYSIVIVKKIDMILVYAFMKYISNSLCL